MMNSYIEKSCLFTIFNVFWHDLLTDKVYSAMKEKHDIIQDFINASDRNKQIVHNFVIALEKSFLSSQKKLVEQCRDELILCSICSQYRGVKVYKPVENDKEIKILESKIKILDRQLKQVSKTKLDAQVSELLLQQVNLSKANYQSEKEIKNLLESLFLEAEKDCQTPSYQGLLRDEEKGLRKQIFTSLLSELEVNDKLNNIFDVKTYLTVSQMLKSS